MSEALDALHSLLKVLYTITLAMAPFTPFLSENIYQRMQQYLPCSMLPEDARSVHFLAYPTVQEKLFDSDIERSFQRMQAVVELARVIRERKGIGLKTPLQSLIIIHTDTQYLDDVKSLERYIIDELNVRELIMTSDEEKYGVTYTAVADWPVLGKRLRKDMPKVKSALAALSSEEVKRYVVEKRLNVAGINLAGEDLRIIRGLRADLSNGLEANSDRDVLVIMDTSLHEGMISEGLAREFINRVQRLRKKANLIATDDVEVVHEIHEDQVGLDTVLDTHEPLFTKTFNRPLKPYSGSMPDAGFIISEEQCILHGEKAARFSLRLARHS